MKTPRERAIEIAYEVMGKQFSRELFRLILEDKGDLGDTVRKLVAAVEAGVERDRADFAKAQAPS